MENVNESVTEGLKSLAAALSRAPQQHAQVRALPKTLNGLRSGTTDTAELEDEGSPTDTEGLDDAAEMAEVNDSDEAAKPKRPRVLRAPQFLSDMDLTAASTPLEAYLAGKNPTSQQDKYLVVAQWFKEFMNTPEITVDHVYTAYESLGWRSQVPQDAGAPLRLLKSIKLVDSGSGRGLYKINWNGTKTVAGMNGTE